jgi:hypothetical protein
VDGITIVVALLMLLGLAGALLPFLPGTPLILAGALLHAIATDFDPLGPWRLAILALLALLSAALGWLGGAIGTRRFGGSRWAVVGALVGAVLGLFAAPVGLLVGPIAGAIVGELLHGARLAQSVRSGLGALLGLVLGVVSHFVVAVIMVALFAWWTLHG